MVYREGKNKYLIKRDTRNWKIFCKGKNGLKKKEYVREKRENTLCGILL